MERRGRLGHVAPAVTRMSAQPLAWWEEVQLQILEHLGEDTTRFRENPDEWRAFREKLKHAHMARRTFLERVLTDADITQAREHVLAADTIVSRRRIVKMCTGCGRAFTLDEWQALPLVGYQPVEDDTDAELRNCTRPTGEVDTISIEVPTVLGVTRPL